MKLTCIIYMYKSMLPIIYMYKSMLPIIYMYKRVLPIKNGMKCINILYIQVRTKEFQYITVNM